MGLFFLKGRFHHSDRVLCKYRSEAIRQLCLGRLFDVSHENAWLVLELSPFLSGEGAQQSHLFASSRPPPFTTLIFGSETIVSAICQITLYIKMLIFCVHCFSICMYGRSTQRP